MRRVLGVLLALMLVFSTALPPRAFANETDSVDVVEEADNEVLVMDESTPASDASLEDVVLEVKSPQNETALASDYTDVDADDVSLVTQASTVRGPKSAGALKVSGNRLVDKNGKAIQLRGVSTHGLAWYPGYVNGSCFKQLRQKWNANVVRLAMYTQEYGGYCSGGNKKELTDLVKKGVRLAAKNDMYAIVDWHILSDGNPNTHVSEAKRFFKEISSTFKNSKNVLYEICNEPNGGTTWKDIKRYAKKVIPVIRKNDPDAVIIVGTPTWSQEVDKAAASPLSYKNVMYALHFYAATHKSELRDRMTSAVRGGLPVFVSEFGVCEASGNGSVDKSSANAWVSTMNDLGVSWCMWSLCNKSESASIIKSGCPATSGFKSGDLTASGKWLLKALKGKLRSGTSGGDGSASWGDVSFESGNFSCTAKVTSSWDMGDGKTCYQYELSITNRGSICTSWAVRVPFGSSISFVNGWNGMFTAKGNNLSIRNADYNGRIESGATLTGIGFQVASSGSLAIKKGASNPAIMYRTYVQSYGWQGWKKNGKRSGTIGKAKRLEGIRIKLKGMPYSGGVKYRTQIQGKGWQGWRKNGKMSGTKGKSLRLEAVRIKLYGAVAKHYDVYYRVHCQGFGWMGWAKNGARSGSSGYSKRLEAIQIVLVKKGSKAPGKTYKGAKQRVAKAYAKRK